MRDEELAAMERRARIFEAANEKILAEKERLREENARLREALKPFAKCIETYPDAKDDYEIGFGGVHDADCKVFIRDFRAAAAAIREGGNRDE